MADDTSIDYLGRPQPLASKRLSLTQSSAGGAGGSVTAPVTPSIGERATEARQAVDQVIRAGANPFDTIGLSKQALSFVKEAQRLFPGSPAASDPAFGTGSPELQAEVAAGRTPQTDIFNPNFIGTPPQVEVGGQAALTPADAAIAAEAEGGSAAAGEAAAAGGSSVGGSVGPALTVIGGALNLAQDITSKQPDDVKAINSAIDAAGTALSLVYGPVAMVGAQFAKQDTARIFADPAGMPYKGAVPGLLPVADLVSMFGGPDLIEKVFGAPGVYDAKRRAAGNAGQADLGALGQVYGQASDPQSLYHDLTAAAGARGEVRSYLTVTSDVAQAVGLPEGTHEWHTLSPQQFMGVLSYFQTNPGAIGAMVHGSGDVAYLNQGAATALGEQAAGKARGSIQRVLDSMAQQQNAQPAPSSGPSAPLEMPVVPAGPSSALGFSRDLLQQDQPMSFSDTLSMP